MQELEQSLGMHEDHYMRFDETDKGYFWGLCFTIFRFRGYMQARPQPAADFPATARYIPLPTAKEVDLRPANASYQLPLPFGNRNAGALDWDDWYVTHSREMGRGGLFDCEWRGYYTYYRSWIPSLDRLDPPMHRIRFVRRESSDGEPAAALEVTADDCVDGLGPFTVEGNVSQVGDVFSFQGYKIYGDGNTAGGDVNWHWKLKLTPLGMTGYWGMLQDNGELFRNGSVWLWKVPA
ncbi:hypothetical protein PRZ48_000675 [Zasmidium cellare]|uniref:Tocopherol cyclase n=1 Tax=Zasmidium cellare TaxID=395010 RepID=A0ABR0EZG0_ZASCE|nr:hypothetical protein PRZ48_000675 [Zasmidium cellare]